MSRRAPLLGSLDVVFPAGEITATMVFVAVGAVWFGVTVLKPLRYRHQPRW